MGYAKLRLGDYVPESFNDRRRDGLSSGVLTKHNAGPMMSWLTALNERIEKNICEDVAAGRDGDDPVEELKYVEVRVLERPRTALGNVVTGCPVCRLQ